MFQIIMTLVVVVLIFCSRLLSSLAEQRYLSCLEHFSSASAITEVLYTRYICLILSLSDSRVPNTWLKTKLKSPLKVVLCVGVLFREPYNSIMRLEALYVTHRSWLDNRETSIQIIILKIIIYQNPLDVKENITYFKVTQSNNPI